MAKSKAPPVDGLSAKDIKRLRSAIRQVWTYSTPRRLVVNRCLIKEGKWKGFSRCESCKTIVPKIFVDHIRRVGDVDEGYIKRMFVSSKSLQGLCKKEHDAKTRKEREEEIW